MENEAQKNPKRGKTVSASDLSDLEASRVLRRLWRRGGELRETIRQEIERTLRQVDPDTVAGDVQTDLELLSVEDLWDRSGGTRHGYVDPTEEATVMVEEALQPWVEEMERYFKLGWYEEALYCCVGILEGIYRYATESASEFKECAPDEASFAFDRVHKECATRCKDEAQRALLQRLIEERCPSRP